MVKDKKLTLIVQSLAMGGAEIFLGDLIVELQKTGWQIKVYSTNKEWNKWLADHKIEAKYLLVVIDITGNWKGLVKACFFFPYAIYEYARIVWSNRNSTFLMSGFFEKTMVSLFAKLFKSKIVWIEFATLQPLFKKFRGFSKWWYFLSISIPQKIITSSEHSYKLLIKDGLPKDKLIVIPCGRKIPRRSLWRHLSKLVKVITNSQTLVCVSRLEPGKGQDLLIKAMPAVLKKFPRTQLQIVGKGNWRADLEHLAQELGITQHVKFLGKVKNTFEIIDRATLVICSSVWELEGFGMVVIEAMALGKPVVAFRSGPYPELIEHQKTGYLCQKGDVDDLAKGIKKLLVGQSLRNKLGKQAHRDFQKRFTIQAVTKEYASILNNYRS